MAAEPTGGPERTCVGCRRVAPAHQLHRFVLVDGVLIADPARRMPGRGAWLHAILGCVSAARERGGFARSFRTRVDDSILVDWLS